MYKDIFCKGIDNLKAVGNAKQISFKSSLKIFFFYFYLCIIASKRTIGPNVFIKNGFAEKNRKEKIDGEYELLFVRRFSNSFKSLNSLVSLPSLLSRSERFAVILKSLFTSPLGLRFLGRWVEFNLLVKVFERCEIKIVYSHGHYDEFVYWLSRLCQLKNARFIIHQHGIIFDSITIPNKIYCNELFVFNKQSENAFRNRVISNDDCIYTIKGLISTVKFEQLQKKSDTKYIGIIDQNNEAWDKKTLESVEKIPGCVGVIMLHPLNKTIQEEVFSDNLIKTRKKFDNLDVIVAMNSTLILDYIAHGFDAPILCTDIEAVNGIFSEYNLLYADENKLVEILEGILK